MVSRHDNRSPDCQGGVIQTVKNFWKRAFPLSLQPVEDAGLALSPRVVLQLCLAGMDITFSNTYAAAIANWPGPP